MSAPNKPGTNSGTATLEQQRARHAWEAVDRAKGKNGEDYAREAKRLPVRIMTSGLGASLAFLDAKNKTEVSDDLADWLLTHRRLFDRGSSQESKTKALKRAIVKRDADFLRHATEEAMLYLKWLTRFAEAELKSED